MNSVGLRHFSLVGRIVIRMASSNSSYEDAIRKLNSLQSNKSTIEQIKKGLKIGQKCTNLEDMEKYLLRVGIPLSKLDELSVIHVAGTKGKGSTSAMCESILRRHGYSTGFYSSPHLVSVRERFRLDGWPLSREEFALHLHRVYELLWDSQEFEGDMPKYFAFLTVVAFHVFLQRRVDVAVVEVGIGGIVDYTNILRKVPVVGITALGLDHTSILGNTLPEIAAAKAGVMKRGCDAYTVRQPADALAVLAEYADHVKCPLTVVPDYSSYTFPEADKSYLPVDLDAYRTNASLAIQLAHAWMRARQTNNVQRSINGHVIKSKNGLGSDILNGTQNGMKKEQNGMKEVVNVLTNGDENLVCNDIHEFQHKITNGINKSQNGISNSIVLNDTTHDSVISQDNVAHSRHKYHNDLQDNVTIGMQNGTISIQNDTNRIQNGTISIQHDANTIQNSTNSIQNGINGTQNCINGLRNGIQNETILIQNDLNGIQNGTIAIQNNQNGIQNGTITIQNNLNGIQNATIAIQNDTNGKQNVTVDKVQNGPRNGNAISKLVLEVPYETAEGLKRCKWAGRYHVLDSDFARFYIDGAHTKESVEICAQWFSDTCSSSNKILLFSTTGDRNVEALLKPLSTIPFRQVYFVQPTAYEKSATDHDNYSVVERRELSERCVKHARAWHEYNPATKISVLECVADALISIKAKGDVPSVLVTGSLYLVGAALSILDPNLNT